jgi:hypothetical protein
MVTSMNMSYTCQHNLLGNFAIFHGYNCSYKSDRCALLPNSSGMGPPRFGFPTRILQTTQQCENLFNHLVISGKCHFKKHQWALSQGLKIVTT